MMSAHKHITPGKPHRMKLRKIAVIYIQGKVMQLTELF